MPFVLRLLLPSVMPQDQKYSKYDDGFWQKNDNPNSASGASLAVKTAKLRWVGLLADRQQKKHLRR
jgi:hypothetical protein